MNLFQHGYLKTNTAKQLVSAVPLSVREKLVQRLYSATPPRTLCTNEDITKGRYRFGEIALDEYLHVQVNPKVIQYWLIFDIDDESAFSWEDNLLPAPNIIVSGPPISKLGKIEAQGGAHLLYAIQGVTTSLKGRRKPIAFLKYVDQAMRIKLGADEGYTGPLCKNPLHPHWKTSFLHSHEYSLNELNDFLHKPKREYSHGFDWSSVANSRNCYLFHQLRFIAYKRINYARENWRFEDWRKHLFEVAETLNNFAGFGLAKEYPMQYKELQSISQSVASWTWSNYFPNHNRGVAGTWLYQIPIQSTALAQREGARYTHRKRRETSEALIKQAVGKLIDTGHKLTQKNIALETGLTRQTVAKYKQIIDDVKYAAPQGIRG
nr:replication initiation protein [Pseudoalteromonas sp. CnMc7-15]